ncbi:MAG: phosphatase PAP2 family protein [Deltaproteobacteria bacterium]|nr:phosphatase PAP2 family protein [Deltaproteobacteria bacterium]
MPARARPLAPIVWIALSLACLQALAWLPARAHAQATEGEAETRAPQSASEAVEAAGAASTEPAAAYEGETGESERERPEVAEDARGEDVMAALTDALDEPGLEEDREQHRVQWRDEWPRYSFDEAVLTVGLGALLVASELLPNSSFTPNWRGGLLFDEGVRSGLRLNTFAERDNARIAADVLMWVNMAFPVVVDAFLAVGIGDGNWDAAFQMGLISIEAYVVSLVVWRVTSLLARRQRPLDTACEAGDTSPHCDSRFATQSFFSNHAANAFTGAALTCLHHSAMPVLGDVGWDSTACVSATLLATAVGMLRVMSDHEYLTDVLTGAAVGWLSGYIIPWLLHYQGGARPELRAPIAVIPAPMISDDTLGLTAAGWF